MLLIGCAFSPVQDPSDAREALKQPEKVLSVFQRFVQAGEFGKAHKCLSPKAMQALSYEEFYAGLTAYQVSRRLITSLEVHGWDPVAKRLRVCSPEFGAGREFRLSQIGAVYLLDLNSGDIDYFAGRILDWHRLQVKKADGWHFAYPPDWTYAPVARACLCGRT